MKISNLSKNYNAKKVVNSVNLEIKKNKVTSFIGPNGAGKSTVMGMISRLILRMREKSIFTIWILPNGIARSLLKSLPF